MQIIVASRMPVYAHGLQAILRSVDAAAPGAAVCMSNGREVIDAATRGECDLAVVDLCLHEVNGLDVGRRLQEIDPPAQVVLLLPDPQAQILTDAIEAGIKGILHSECSTEDLRRAIETVTGGDSFLCPVCTTALVQITASPENSKVDPVIAHLTPREREVLQLIAEGMSSRQVAQRLNISPKTVDTHRRHVMRKLDADSVAELVKSAIRAGLTPI